MIDNCDMVTRLRDELAIARRILRESTRRERVKEQQLVAKEKQLEAKSMTENALRSKLRVKEEEVRTLRKVYVARFNGKIPVTCGRNVAKPCTVQLSESKPRIVHLNAVSDVLRTLCDESQEGNTIDMDLKGSTFSHRNSPCRDDVDEREEVDQQLDAVIVALAQSENLRVDGESERRELSKELSQKKEESEATFAVMRSQIQDATEKYQLTESELLSCKNSLWLLQKEHNLLKEQLQRPLSLHADSENKRCGLEKTIKKVRSAIIEITTTDQFVQLPTPVTTPTTDKPESTPRALMPGFSMYGWADVCTEDDFTWVQNRMQVACIDDPLETRRQLTQKAREMAPWQLEVAERKAKKIY